MAPNITKSPLQNPEMYKGLLFLGFFSSNGAFSGSVELVMLTLVCEFVATVSVLQVETVSILSFIFV
jgi:hypothetical protein